MPPKRSTRSEHPTLEAIPPKVRSRPPTANKKPRAPPEPVYNADEHEKDNVAPVRGRKAGSKKRTASSKRSLPRMETQEVIVLSGTEPVPASSQEDLWPIEESETEEESQVDTRRAHSPGDGGVTPQSRSRERKPGRAQSAGDAQSIPRTRNRSRKGRESSDQLFSSPPRISSTPRRDIPPPVLSTQETQEQEEMDEILRAAVNSPVEPPLRGSISASHDEESDQDDPVVLSSPEHEASPFQMAKHYPRVRMMRRERKSYLDYDDPPTPKPALDADPSSPEDGQEIDDITLFTLRVKQYQQALKNVRSRMEDLAAAFTVLKPLQNVTSGNDKGYLNILSDLASVIINNDARQLSKEEKFQLGVFDEAMSSLAHFEQETKDFELIFDRFKKHNKTQRENIQKCRAGIMKTMRERGYKNMEWRVEEQEDEDEGKRRKMKSFFADLEKGGYGYHTPESAEERGGKRRITKDGGYEDQERPESRIQKRRRIEIIERVRQLDDSLHMDRDEKRKKRDVGNETEEKTQETITIRDGGEDEQRYVINDHGGDEVEERNEGDEKRYHEERMEEDSDSNEQVNENEEEMRENQGEEYEEEVYPIIIDEDDVEVVRVEGFGERQKKAREREERLERDEGEVEVLEDHEWEDAEICALLDGISKFHGGAIETRFFRIKNRYRAELENRSVEAIIEKARELKKEIVDSGEEDILGGFWDGI